MAKAADKAKKKSAFMKPVRPSEHLGQNCRNGTTSAN